MGATVSYILFHGSGYGVTYGDLIIYVLLVLVNGAVLGTEQDGGMLPMLLML
jgi:hypothetical protein